MRLFPTLNPPVFFQATNQLIHFSWQAIKNNLSLSWMQPEETSFFMSASEEAGFRQHQAWRSAFKNQLRTLRQQMTEAYRAGQMLSPDKLRETLVAEQATFTSQAVSALFYDRSLKRLAQRFPHYAHALEGVAEHFKATLKAYPQKALRYFYHDIVNYIVLWSGDKITLAQLMDALEYYQALVPTHLYQKIQTALQGFNVPALENHANAFQGVPRKTVEALLAQINQTFANHATKSDEVSPLQTSLQRFANETHLLVQQGLDYAKQHPYQVMTTLTVATVLGYRYHLTAADNALISAHSFSYFSEFNSFPLSGILPPVIMTFSALPLALSVSRSATYLSVAIPFITLWFSQCLPVNAQTTWAKSLGGTSYDYGYSVQQTSDGGYIVVGHTDSFGPSYRNLWLSKWMENGTLSWVKTLGGTSSSSGYSVQQTSDGGYIVVGDNTGSDLWLSKWMENGTLSWVKTLGASSGSNVGKSVQQTSDGGYIVTGYTNSFGAGNTDLWLSKWGENGTLSWVKTLGGTGYDYGYSVQQTSDGGYIVTGWTGSFGAGNNDLWLSKWGENGTLSWVKTLGGTGNDDGYSVQQTSDGGYIVTGYTASFGAGSDLWLSKWMENGTLSWVKTLGGWGTGYSVQQTSDGGYIVGGGDGGLTLSKWMENGTLSWIKNLSGTDWDYGKSVQQTSDGGYIVTGHTGSFGVGGFDLWLSKWDNQGSIAGMNCIAQPSVNNNTPTVNSTNLNITPGTPAVTAQAAILSAQTVNPTLQTLFCNSVTTGGATTNPVTTSRATTGVATTSPITTSRATTGVATTSPVTTSRATTAIATTSPVTTSRVTTGIATTTPVTTAATTDSLTTPVTTDNEGMSGLATTAATPFNALSSEKDTSTAVIGGLAAGSAVALLLCVGGTLFCYQRYRKRNVSSETATDPTQDTLDIMLSPEREEKHTVIGQKYALLNKLNRKEAAALYVQEGIVVPFPEGKAKTKFQLGKGRFGKLRIAQDIQSGQFVGVKKIKGSAEIAVSQREAALQSLLKGKPHLMPLLDSVETVGSHDEAVLYQFMPLASWGNGDAFTERLGQVGDASHQERLLGHMARGLLQGIAHLHASQIYHLDLKPSNVVLDRSGMVYIIDFGCAVSGEEAVGPANGDSRYFSPERLASCKRQGEGETSATFSGPKADAWALGLTLLEMALGTYPFERCSFAEKLTKWDAMYFQAKLQDISALQSPAPDSLWAVIRGLLEPDPANRLTISQALAHPVFKAKNLSFASASKQAEAFEALREPATSPVPIRRAMHSPHDPDQHYAYVRVGTASEPLPRTDNPNPYEQTPARPVSPHAFFQPVLGSGSGTDGYVITVAPESVQQDLTI